MSDLISRQKAIEAINAIDNYDDGMCFEVLSHAVRDVSLLPSVDAIVLDKALCKCSKGDYILYNRKWLYRHLRQEFNILAKVSGLKGTGKWLHKWSGDGSVWLEQRCSECGIVFEDEPHDYEYCPNCGANMRGWE